MEAVSPLKDQAMQLPASLQASCVRCGEQFSGASELQSHSLLCCYSTGFDEEDSHQRSSAVDGDEEDLMEEDDDDELEAEVIQSPVRGDVCSPQKVIQISSGGFVMPPIDKNKASYYCEICRKNFTNYGSYRRHLRMHFCDKKYSCHLCGRQFFRRYLWVKHQEKIHGNDPSSCRCPHCGLWSKNADSLKEHLRTKHRRTNGKEPTNAASMPAPVNPFEPESPTKAKKQKNVLVDIKNPVVPPPLQECFKCRECDAEFPTEAEVEEHCAVEHDAEQLSAGSTSRYGRKRKQRVLFNTELRTGKRRRKSSTSSSTTPSTAKVGDVSPSPEGSTLIRNGLENDSMDASMGSPPPPNLGSPLPPPLMGSPQPPNLTPAEEDDVQPVLTLALEDKEETPTTTNSVPPKHRKQRGQRGSFYCEKCNRMFINRSSYLRHRKMHTGIKPFTCDFCCISFFRSESLASHKKKHVDPTDIRCYLCGYRAANSAALRTHFYTLCGRDKNVTSLATQMQDDMAHANPMEVQPLSSNDNNSAKDTGERDIAGFCSLCNRAFFNRKNFDKHMRLHNTAAPSYSCTLCNKMFNDEKQYQTHLQTHSGNKPLSSLELLKSFGATQGNSLEESVENSQRIVKSEPIEIIEDSVLQTAKTDVPNAPLLCCKLCPLAFTSHHSYMKHAKYHEKHSLGFCRYCGKPFTSKKQLNNHERSCYMTCCRDDKMYSCYGCSIYFDGTENLVQHVRTAHVNAEDAELPNFRDLEQELEGDDENSCSEIPILIKDEAQDIEETVIDLHPNDKDIHIRKGGLTIQEDELEVTLVKGPSHGGGRDESNIPIAVKVQQRYKCGRCNDTFGDLKAIFSHFHKTHGVAQASNGLDAEKVAKELSSVSSTPEIIDSGPCEPSNSIMKQLLSTPPGAIPTQKLVLNCGLCFKSFKEKAALDHHEQLSHVMVDWYKCDVCGKSGSHETMKSHMLSHMHKVGSVVTAVGADLPDIDSPDDNNNNERDEDDDFSTRGDAADDEGNGARSPSGGPRNPLEVISVLCQLCKKIFSSTTALSKHRHTGYNLSVTHPFICCMPNCGQCFTLREDILAHLKTQHTNSTWNINRIHNSGPTWSDDLVSGPGPFSQSLLQLSLQTLADNEAKRSSSFGSLLDIYDTPEGKKPSASGGGGDVEEITVEPLLEGLQEPHNSNVQDPPTEDEDFRDEDPSPTPPSSPSTQEAPSYLEDKTKVLLKCDDCDSVFTNPCSWKRHRKLHLGIMKHKCPHCSRMFYRKDHCDKHVKTHSRVIRPKPSLDK